VLNFIYYPVSAIMWFWHKVFGFVFGEASGASWVLSVVFLVFTLRALLYKPFVSQVRSMRKMQEFAPEIQKLKKKYGNDRQKMAAEMQKLQSQQGVNPLGGCLPILVQIPVFIGLFHVLREFTPGKTQNYVFGESEIESFNAASIFGAKLGAAIVPWSGGPDLAAYGTTVTEMLVVMLPLMIVAGVLTHLTARHSVARQTEAQAANPQSAIMNKLMLYVFPVGVVVGAPFLPLAVLFYWVANNLWTLGQQHVVYKRIDAEEAAKREQATTTRQARAPRPGQKPVRPETTPAEKPEPPKKIPGAKPVTRRNGSTAGDAKGGSGSAGPAGNGSVNGSTPGVGPAAEDGSAARNGSGAASGAEGGDGAPVPDADGGTGPSTRSGRTGKGPGGGSSRGGRPSGGSRPPARRGRKRR
jgi:YidC/Oxa1 family membrane protein insertase